MKYFKRNKGITLIALVVTIIIILIIAGVTISLVANGGLFEYAGNAAGKTKIERDKEQNFANVEGGLSTEDLIAKFTTNKEEDLAKLRLYFTGTNGEGVLYSILDDGYCGFTNNEVIPDANTSIIYVNDIDDYYIISYHNNYYRVYFEPSGDFDKLFTSVVPFSDEETLAVKITNNGTCIVGSNNFGYWSYNNMIYKIQNGAVTEQINLPTNDVIVLGKEEYIRFVPTTNEKWIDWANIAGGNDIDLSDFDTGLTLKGLIIECNEKNNKEVHKSKSSGSIYIDVELKKESNVVLSTDYITAGKVYITNISFTSK